MEEIKTYLDELLEKSTPEKPIWNLEAIIENKPPHWSYIDGCMALGILDMYEATKEEKYFTFLEEFIDFYVAEDGKILGYDLISYNSDAINEGKLLFPLYEKTGKEKYRKAADLLYQQIKWQPRLKNGSFWHKLIYPYQVWLDGLYMVEPFYLAYDLHYHKGKNLPDIMLQFENVFHYLKDEKTGLFYHGYDESGQLFWGNPKTGQSANFWTRSLGWYAMSLVDAIDLLGAVYPKEKAILKEHLQTLMKALLTYQDKETKLFYQVTDKSELPGNYLETSGSAAIAYTLMKGSRLKLFSETKFAKGEEILRQIVKEKLTFINGEFALKDICLVAGLGGMNGRGNYPLRDGSYTYYISEPRVKNDAKGVAPLLYAYSEYLKKEN